MVKKNPWWLLQNRWDPHSFSARCCAAQVLVIGGFFALHGVLPHHNSCSTPKSFEAERVGRWILRRWWPPWIREQVDAGGVWLWAMDCYFWNRSRVIWVIIAGPQVLTPVLTLVFATWTFYGSTVAATALCMCPAAFGCYMYTIYDIWMRVNTYMYGLYTCIDIQHVYIYIYIVE